MTAPKDPVRRAAALEWRPDSDMDAPVIRASGSGEVADAIIAAAEAEGIPVERDDSLAAALSSLPPGTEIPEETFMAVAKIIAILIAADRIKAP